MTQQTKDKIEKVINVTGVVISGVLWALQVVEMLHGGKVK